MRHLQEVAEENGIPTVTGYTISADGFYEDEARTDGFFCEFGEEEKFAYFKKIHDAGVRNIEMESLVFLAFALRAHVRAGVACSVLIDRLQVGKLRVSRFVGRPDQVVGERGIAGAGQREAALQPRQEVPGGLGGLRVVACLLQETEDSSSARSSIISWIVNSTLFRRTTALDITTPHALPPHPRSSWSWSFHASRQSSYTIVWSNSV